MAISVRMDPLLEQALTLAAKRLGVTLRPEVASLIARYTSEGRKAVRILADSYGRAHLRKIQGADGESGVVQGHVPRDGEEGKWISKLVHRLQQLGFERRRAAQRQVSLHEIEAVGGSGRFRREHATVRLDAGHRAAAKIVADGFATDRSEREIGEG